ncbi:MAG: S8 family serine peptidase [Elusimicrobia bacterium]|nr:S8 family serine peptidase [Elusimicrobiota bacterium]
MVASKRPLAAALALVVVSYAASSAMAQDPSKSRTQIVSFQEGLSPEARAAAVTAAGGRVEKDLPFVDAVVVSFGIAPQAAMRLKANPAVEAVEPNEYRKWIEAAPAPLSSVAFPTPAAALRTAAPVPSLGPGEPKADAEKPSEVPWGVERLHAPQIWSRATGKGVKVAVIDTGIDATHPDIAPNHAGGFNAVEPGSEQTDEHGHGTHVAGTVAGASNKMGVIGVAPEARLYGVKVLDKDGGGTTDIVVAGIAWTVENGMQVVNMSLGGPSSTALKKAVQKAAAAGVVIVAAAGNDPEAPVSAPAMYPEAIAVSASTAQDGLADFSTTGPEVDFIAPGHEIVSAWPGRKLAKLSGTSMASPHVAGLAALAVQLGARGAAGVKAALKKAAVPLSGLNEAQQGNGIVEVDRWFK